MSQNVKENYQADEENSLREFNERQIQIAKIMKEKEAILQQKYKDVFSLVQEQNYLHAGAGSYYSQFYKNYSKFDRFGIRYITPNKVNSGVMFMTRPRLCLQSNNLRVNRFLSLFDTTDPFCVQFMIRNYLDTVLTQGEYNPTIKKNASISPFFDPKCAFMPLLTNNIRDATGFPSQSIETETMDGGFFGEDQRIAAGSDMNKKSFDVQLSFTDPQGGPIMALFQLWITYISLVTVGECIAYTDDVEQKRLNYTVSLYRFTLDTSRKYILHMSKCTGCFPINLPIGAVFDMSRNETFVEAAKDFTVTFACNGYDVNEPIVATEFNTVAKRYFSLIDSPSIKVAPSLSEFNYTGYPYIYTEQNKLPELQYRYFPDQGKSIENKSKSLKQSIEEVDAIHNKYDSRINQLIYV